MNVERDCNTCKFHRQGAAAIPEKCRACVHESYVEGGRYLPYWSPRLELMETLEVADVSPHTVVSDYKPNAVLHTPAHKTAPANDGKAATYDDGKAPLAVLPWAALDAMAMVQAYGHKKYGDFHNYRKGMEVSRNLSCAIRHIRDYMNGHDTDHESNLNPLAHALTRIAFVMQNLADGTAIDDRYKGRAA